MSDGTLRGKSAIVTEARLAACCSLKGMYQVTSARFVRLTLLLVVVFGAWFGLAQAQSADERICYHEGFVSYVPMAGHVGRVSEPWTTLIEHTVQLLGEYSELFRHCDDVHAALPGETGQSLPYLIVYVHYPMRGGNSYDEDSGSVEVFLNVEKYSLLDDGSSSIEELYFSRLYTKKVEVSPPDGTHVPVETPVRDFQDHATEIAKLFVELQLRQLVEAYRLE